MGRSKVCFSAFAMRIPGGGGAAPVRFADPPEVFLNRRRGTGSRVPWTCGEKEERGYGGPED